MIQLIPNGNWLKTVNVVDVMGKGIALQFRQRFPEMFLMYKSACQRKGCAKLGRWVLASRPARGSGP
jgi:hypothetical protein